MRPILKPFGLQASLAVSAEAKWSFSIIKTKTFEVFTSRRPFDDLMIIQSESKNIRDFSPSECIELWLRSGHVPWRPYSIFICRCPCFYNVDSYQIPLQIYK